MRRRNDITSGVARSLFDPSMERYLTAAWQQRSNDSKLATCDTERWDLLARQGTSGGLKGFVVYGSQAISRAFPHKYICFALLSNVQACSSGQCSEHE